DACEDYYNRLVRALGPDWGDEQEINLLDILEKNGVADCIWALRATEQGGEKIARLIACDIVELILPIYEKAHPGDIRPRVIIETSRRFANGTATKEELNQAKTVALTMSTAGDVAGAAGVKRDVELTAMAAMAATVAWVTGDAEREYQAGIIRKYLEN
ncbi:MAG: hypothetical protein ACYCOU_13345, partial [Sulfobacillus sp.]